MRFARISALLLLVAFQASAQVRKPTPIPSTQELRAFVPKGYALREAFRTKLTPSGETILLYDDGEEFFPRICLVALHDGQKFTLIDGGITGVGGFLLMPLSKGENGLVVVYHVGQDFSDDEFAIFTGGENSYSKVFFERTTEGQMRIVSTDPIKFTLSSAAAELDPKDPERSCVWCLHRFRTKTYVWDAQRFRLTNKVLTKEFLKPVDPGNAFIMQGAPGVGKKR